MLRATAIAFLLAATGCTSISSIMLTRNECNTGWNTIRHLKGVPITVKVPTHLKVYVYDKHFMKEGEFMKPEMPIRDFATELMYTEKVFTVDFKRPAAGAYNLDLDMTEDQYIQKISHDVTDETIKDVTALLGALPGLGVSLASDDGASQEGAISIQEIKSVAAVGMFEVDDPNFESEVTKFINCHLNQSHDAWVVAPGAGINRTHLPDNEAGTITPLCPDCFSSGTPGQFVPLMPEGGGMSIPHDIPVGQYQELPPQSVQ